MSMYAWVDLCMNVRFLAGSEYAHWTVIETLIIIRITYHLFEGNAKSEEEAVELKLENSPALHDVTQLKAARGPLNIFVNQAY